MGNLAGESFQIAGLPRISGSAVSLIRSAWLTDAFLLTTTTPHAAHGCRRDADVTPMGRLDRMK